MEDIQIQKPKIHIFMCTNDRTGKNSEKPSCGPKIDESVFREVKNWLREEGLAQQVYCSRTHCLGFCNPLGGVIMIYPKMRYIRGVQDAQDIRKVILEELK